MDNITHSLLALALAKTRAGSRSPLSALALITAANFPDADAVVLLAGLEPYMLHHRGITHAALGLVVQWIVLGGIFEWLERKLADRAGRARPERGPVWFAIFVGLISHPLLDYLNSYGVRPWLPFDDCCIYGDMIFIIDPYLWLLFGGAAAIAGGRGRLERWLLIGSGVIATAVVYGSGRTPGELRIAWPVALVAIVLLRRMGEGSPRTSGVVPGMFLILFLYLFAMLSFGERAESSTRRSIARELPEGETVIRSSRTPVPADPLAWTVHVETESHVFQRSMRLDSADSIQWKIAKNTKLPEVVAASQTDHGIVWRKFARHPLASVIRDANGNPTHVVLLDARFGLDPILNRSRIEVPVR